MKPISAGFSLSLFARVFILYSASLFLFSFAALGLFYQHQFDQEVEDAYESVSVLADVLTPTLSDSAVIGDFDTVKRSLAKAAASRRIASAEFIDISGTALRVAGNAPEHAAPPAWISARVAARLGAVNRNITVGGRDYGVFRINFSSDFVAQEIWLVTKVSLLVAALFLLPGNFLILLALRPIVADLATATRFARQLVSHAGSRIAVNSRVLETQELVSALNKVSLELTAQHQALTDSEIRKSAILEAALDCFITINDAGEIVDFNAAAERTFGYSADEVRGRTMSATIVPPPLRTAHDQGMKHYLATGHGPVLRQRIEITAMRRGGEEFPIELAVVPFEAEGRQFFAGFIRDISPRKALEAEQERITALLKQSVHELEYQKFALDQHSIVSIADAGGNITYANQKFTDISGYSREELLGSNHRIVKSSVHDTAFFQNLWTTIAGGKVWHGQIANRNKHGEIYWVAATIVPWLDAAGLPYQYVSIRTDITAQKKVEEALGEARRRELATGSEIQRSLLLGDLPQGLHGAHLATYTEPSQGVDGDFFAITRFRPDCFELLVGDVMGKGVPAALIGAGVKSSYNKVLAELLAQALDQSELPSPAQVINALHQHLTPRLIELSAFVTLALYRFDCAAGTLSLVNAGHTPGLLARSGGELVTVNGENLPIGVISEEVYVDTTLSIEAGDTLLAYSDGISEASNASQQEFGAARLGTILRAGCDAGLPPSALLQSIRQEVRNFVGSSELSDDQTAVMVEVQARRQGERGDIDQRRAPSLLVLPWRLDQLGLLRQEIAAATGRLPPVEVDALILASFEAATNILRHAQPYFSDATLACRIRQEDARYVVELIYPGPNFSPPADPTPDFSGNSEGGFGLYIIEHCVDSVEYATLLPGVSCIRLIKRIPPSLTGDPA